MITILFILFLMGFIFKGIGLAIRLSWGILKFLVSIVFWPLILIGMVFSGLLGIAFLLLLAGGIVLLIRSFAESHGSV